MNRFLHLLMALAASALAASALAVCAQTAADYKRPVVDGIVESVGGRLRVSLTNTDNARGFSGEAQVSIDAPNRQSKVSKFEFTLAPQESRLFPLDSQGAAGDVYTLSIHERAGTLILLKNATINRGVEAAPIVLTPPKASIRPAPAATPSIVVKELTVKARLAAGRPGQPRRVEATAPVITQPVQPQGAEAEAPTTEQSSEPQIAIIKKPSAKLARRKQSGVARPAVVVVQQPNIPEGARVEAPIYDDPDSIVLAFEIMAPSPIINASLSVSANDFKERQTVTIRNSASAEFNLPDDFNEPKIAYTLTDATGKTLIAGELDFEALRMEDSVRISEVKLDKESYTPGQSAQIVVTLEGRSQYGFLLEVTAKDENGSPLLSESRKGIFSKGKSILEFKVEIPAETHGIVGVEFKAFGKLTKKLFDSGTRDLIINETQNDKSEDRGSRVED